MAHPVNWLAVGTASLIPLAVGSVWYSKYGFLNVWSKSIGINEENQQQSGHKAYIYVVSVVVSIALAYFLSKHVAHGGDEFHTFKHGAFHGVRLGALVILPPFIINALFEGRNWTYILINLAYWLLCCTLMGGLLCVWR